jgi:hypothetical protein
LCVVAGLEFFGLLRVAHVARLRRDHHRDTIAIVIEGVGTGLIRLVALVTANAYLRVPTGSSLLNGQRSGSAFVTGDARLAFFGSVGRELRNVGSILCRCCTC